jgi:hypothetical protein
VVFIGTSTLSGAFLARLKDFVKPLISVNEYGKLFAMCCKYVNFKRSPNSLIRGYEVGRRVPIDFLALCVVHEIFP